VDAFTPLQLALEEARRLAVCLSPVCFSHRFLPLLLPSKFPFFSVEIYSRRDRSPLAPTLSSLPPHLPPSLPPSLPALLALYAPKASRSPSLSILWISI
jgi:hypothetical protein